MLQFLSITQETDENSTCVKSNNQIAVAPVLLREHICEITITFDKSMRTSRDQSTRLCARMPKQQRKLISGSVSHFTELELRKAMSDGMDQHDMMAMAQLMYLTAKEW